MRPVPWGGYSVFKMSFLAKNLPTAIMHRKTLLNYTHTHDVTDKDGERPMTATMYVYNLSESQPDERDPDRIIIVLRELVPLDTTNCSLLVIVPMSDVARMVILHNRIRAAINEDMPVSVMTDMELLLFRTNTVRLSRYIGNVEKPLDTLPLLPLHDPKARLYGLYEGDVVKLQANEHMPSNMLMVRDLSGDSAGLPANSGGSSSGLVYTIPWRCIQCSMPITTGMSQCCLLRRKQAQE